MTGEVLKMANSSLYAGKESVTNLSDAFARIGEDRLISILYIGLSRMFVRGQNNLIPITESIVDHSYTVANIASLLAKRFHIDEETAFLTGLLHDIGKIAIICDMSTSTDVIDLYESIQEDSLTQILDPMHEYVGEMITSHWNLEEDITHAVGNHHDIKFCDTDTENNSPRLSALISFSNTMAHILGFGMPIQVINIFELNSARILGITDTDEHIQSLNKIPYLLFENFIDLFPSD